MSEPTLDAVIQEAQKLAERLSHVPPCLRQPKQESSCVSLEGQRPLEPAEMKSGAIVRAIHMYNFNNMCNACAAYWFVTMAEIELRHVKKMEHLR